MLQRYNSLLEKAKQQAPAPYCLESDAELKELYNIVLAQVGTGYNTTSHPEDIPNAANSTLPLVMGLGLAAAAFLYHATLLSMCGIAVSSMSIALLMCAAFAVGATTSIAISCISRSSRLSL